MATTYTGRLLTPTNFGVPAPLDIAVQLGRLPRFAGATRHWPWSVLHHVVASVRYAEQTRQPLEVRKILALHDAEECATGDIPTTWKNPDMRMAQGRLSSNIFEVYTGYSRSVCASFSEEVKRTDHIMLVAEMHVVGPPNVLEHSGLDVAYINPAHLDVGRDIVADVRDKYHHPWQCQMPWGSLVRDYMDLLVGLCGLNLQVFGEWPKLTPPDPVPLHVSK